MMYYAGADKIFKYRHSPNNNHCHVCAKEEKTLNFLTDTLENTY